MRRLFDFAESDFCAGVLIGMSIVALWSVYLLEKMKPPV